MASHFLSVCMFCLLCATHSPCESHAGMEQELLADNPNILMNEAFKVNTSKTDLLQPKSRINSQLDTLNNKGYAKHNRLISNKHIRSTTEKVSESLSHDNSNNNVSTIDKIESNMDSKLLLEEQYVKRIFEKYGNGETMTLDGFQKLMHHVSFKFHSLPEDVHVDAIEKTDNIRNSTSTKCFDQEEFISSILPADSNSTRVNGDILKNFCPVILYTMIFGTCNLEHGGEHAFSEDSYDLKNDRFTVWLYSNLAVIIVSVCGVVGLAVIPIMQKRYYQSLLQFLVALAVGTLAGDALLHLLPHAMSTTSGNDHDGDRDGRHHHDHTMNMWKGLVAMMGLILFFVTEKIIIFAAKWRKKSQLKKKMPKMKVMRSNDHGPAINGNNEHQCKHKYSSIPYCYDTITMMDASQCHESVESHNDTATTTFNDIDSECEVQSFKKSNSNGSHKLIESNQNMTECPTSKLNGFSCTDGNKMLENQNNRRDSNSIEEYTVILREHENKHHGHSHTHGHVHAAPQNMSSVAWMVIMGDGLHNFTDGMAIGAAFTGGVAGGFSTAVAVFCHELPHELGDFAMLLKAGMSMKQALFYNLLSSFLCLMGNAFGVWLGEMESASSWVFAAAAGTFIYIALVDMIPELSSGHDEDSSLLQCFLHLSGLLLGCAIMAVIALYEHDLKNIF